MKVQAVCRAEVAALPSLGHRGWDVEGSRWYVVVRPAQDGQLHRGDLLAVVQPPGQLAVDEALDLGQVNNRFQRGACSEQGCQWSIESRSEGRAVLRTGENHEEYGHPTGS